MMYRRPARDAARARRRAVAPGPRPPRRPASSRRRLFVGAGVVVAVMGAVLGVALAGRPSAAPASDVTEPAAYEIVYQVDNTSTGADQRSWEVLDVTDPLDVSDLSYDRDPRLGTPPVSGTVTDADALYDVSGNSRTFVSFREPGLGSGAEALGAERTQLLALGLARSIGGAMTLAGARCSRLEMSEPPVGPVTPIGGDGDDVLCLSPNGLELGETWTYRGRVVLERRAVEVLTGTVDRRIAPAPPAPPAPPGGGSALLEVGPATGPLPIPPPARPPGLAAGGVVSILAHDPQDPTRLLYQATEWTYLRGGSLITVEAGTGATPWDDRAIPTRAVRLAGLGAATEVLDSEGPELQVQEGAGRWIRFRGTVPVAELVAYASSLSGGGPTGS